MKLRKIDLTKSCASPEGGGGKQDHPDIKTNGTHYRVKYDGVWYEGTFGRQWYGLNFNGIFDAGAQYDAPGTNASMWEEIHEIVRAPAVKAKSKKPKAKKPAEAKKKPPFRHGGSSGDEKRIYIHGPGGFEMEVDSDDCPRGVQAFAKKVVHVLNAHWEDSK